ncbi:hypothetical protein JT359_14890 [Candidatus Poribacteria bacterium]|nr:hypothetical protein [Candidatus Poribacteria bacterium]
MKFIIPLTCICIILASCQLSANNEDQPVLAGMIERNLTITTGREYSTGFGEDYGTGNIRIQKTNSYLTLRMTDFRSSIDIPRTLRTILDSFEGNLFQQTITIGDSWEQRGFRGGIENVTLVSYEDVKIGDKLYPKCLKHKTIIKDANWESKTEFGNALVNGTRYLWLSPGIGIVKLLYEHSNGITTEGELIESDIQTDNTEMFPIDIGSSWTYKWKNDFENYSLIEKIKVFNNTNSENSLKFNTYVILEDGKKMLDGNFYFWYEKDPILRLSGSGYSSSGRETPQGPDSIFINLIENHYPELLRYPIKVGKSWNKEGFSNVDVTTTIEEFQTIETSFGTFKDCLKHKTVFKGATTFSNPTPQDLLRIALINGTRYLWFAKGIGIVKLRYEHANGITTEAELIDYNIPNGSAEYFPLNTATTWTYKWKNEYQPRPIIEKVQILDIHAKPEISLIDSKYTITISDENEPGEMFVDFQLLPESSINEEMKLRLQGDSDYIPQHSQFVPDQDQYKTKKYPFLRGITVAPHARGNPHFKEYPYPSWTLQFFKNHAGGTVNIHYEISTEYAKYYKGFQTKRYGTQALPRSRPIFRDKSMVWSGSDLFIIGGKADNIEVEFILPDGWNVLTPWNRIDNTGHRFSVENQEELTQNYIMFGKYDQVIANSGKRNVVIGLDSKFKSTKDEIRLTVEKFLKAYTQLFKDEDEKTVTFIINSYENESQQGMEGHGRRGSVSIFMEKILNPNTKSVYGPFLGHEVFHIWNGLTSLQRFSSKETWFNEGITKYYSDITARQLGYLTENEFLSKLKNTCEKYLSVSHELAIGDDYRDSRLVYEGGSLVAASLDLQIRHHSKNRKNFNQVMQDMYRKFPDKSIEFTNEDIIRSVNKLSDKDMRPFFNKYVLGKERLPLKEFLAYAGLDFEITSYEKIPTYEYVIKILKESLNTEKMIDISSVDSNQVMSTLDLCKMAVSWKTGDVIELTYKDIGDESEFKTEMVTLKGISDNPPTFQEVSVSITKVKEMNKMQRRIYTGLFEKE